MVTSDLATGHELSRTHWSGPGTLTLASLAARAHQNVVKYNNLFKRKATPAHYNTEEVEVFEVPPELQESLQPHPVPPAVIGAVCRSQYDCSAALRAVCAVDKSCRVRKYKMLDIYFNLSKTKRNHCRNFESSLDIYFSTSKAVSSLVSVHRISTEKPTVTNLERHFPVMEVLSGSKDLSDTMRNVSMTSRSTNAFHDQDCSDI